MYLILTIVIVGGIIALSFTKFEIREDIIIEASSKDIWEVLTDLENYDKWSSQISYHGGNIKDKSKIKLRLAALGSEPYEFIPTITRFEPYKEFAWLGISGFDRVFDGERFFILKEIEEHKTLFIHKEVYSGVISLLMKRTPMLKRAPQGFILHNQEIKKYVEERIKE